jgi:lipopolysaccharide transport system ATP-binding protein
LAFAVAAYLESEILIVDEVLAVGDAEFQKKCLGKMSDVSKGEGRTVLFVSHNIGAINTLTDKCIYLKDGHLIDYGDTEKIVSMYLNDSSISNIGQCEYDNAENFNDNKPIQLKRCKFAIESDTVVVDVEYVVRKTVGSVVAIKIINSKDVPIITLMDIDRDVDVFQKKEGIFNVRFNFPISNLAPDTFKITVSFADMKSERFDYHADLLVFEKNNLDYNLGRQGVIFPDSKFIDLTKNTFI